MTWTVEALIGTYIVTAESGAPITSGDSTKGVYLWGAQLETGSTATAYQKVTTTTDVTEAGKADCWGLLADGVDDWLVTPSISFNTHTQDTRRNLLVDTESVASSVWVNNGTTDADNVTTAPNGTLTAGKITEDIATGVHIWYRTVTLTNGINYVWSVHVKAAERGWCYVAFNTGTWQGNYINLATGEVGANFLGDPDEITVTDVGDGWWRVAIEKVSTSTSGEIRIGLANGNNGGTYTGDGSSGIYAWGFQLEEGTLTDYQRVGTDKMTVMAGVRKLSDADRGFVCELTTTWQGNNGAFALEAPASAASESYRIASKGTSSDARIITTYTAPITNVVTMQADIAESSLIGRINGVEVSSTNTSQGSGNYSNAVMYLLTRNLADRFNGILYSLIVRGKQTPTGTIRDFERNLLAKRAGVLL